MKYYIFHNGHLNNICNDLQAMIKWFSHYNDIDPWHRNKVKNRIFDDISMHPNDTYTTSERYFDGVDWANRIIHPKRLYMVKDEYNRTIDPREYSKEILEVDTRKYKYSYSIRKDKCGGKYPTYRYDPIPYISKRKGGPMSTAPRLIRDKRESFEYLSYYKWELGYSIKYHKEDHLFRSRYDDAYYRDNTRSWKDNKVQKQWMKNL